MDLIILSNQTEIILLLVDIFSLLVQGKIHMIICFTKLRFLLLLVNRLLPGFIVRGKIYLII